MQVFIKYDSIYGYACATMDASKIGLIASGKKNPDFSVSALRVKADNLMASVPKVAGKLQGRFYFSPSTLSAQKR